MNDVNVQQYSSGGWFLPLLTLIFVIAKITGHISWSWWLVFLPIWGPVALVLSIGLIAGVLYAIRR